MRNNRRYCRNNFAYGCRASGGEVIDPASPPILRAREAASRQAWAEAYELFVEAQAKGGLAPEDRALLAQVAYAAGHLDVTIETWERIHAESIASGNIIAGAGAAVRVAMHLLFDTALMAPVRGWLARAERLLAAAEASAPGASAVQAWLAVVRNYERMLSGDADGARPWARRAIELGAEHDGAAAAIGRIAEARGLILAGDVDVGLRLLDEAGVAAVSGELDPLSTGVVYCELVCALQGLALVDLAEEWTNAMERWCSVNAIGSLHGRCRVHRAEILRFRGSFGRAEEELRIACDELRPYVRRELGWPLCELGRVRFRQGDVDGAEQAFFAAHEVGWEAQPGLALVQLARGDHAGAAAGIAAALARPAFTPSKELPPDNDLWRFPLLEAQVDIGVAAGAGELGRARQASDELGRIAGRFKSKPLEAGAVLARGRVLLHAGKASEAEHCFEQAARRWHDLGAPYEAARARMALADARRAMGNHAGAELERRAARAIRERLGIASSGTNDGAGALASRPPELRVAARSEPAPAAQRNAFILEGDTWAVSFEQQTIRIADRRGMQYLAKLIGRPGHEHHVLDLVGTAHSLIDGGGAGPHLDATAKQMYQRRLADIDEDLAEAERDGDLGRAERCRNEREILLRELARAFGRAGRERPGAGSAAERARVSVTRAIRQSIARIAEYHASLGEHLASTIKTGTFCSYAPDPRSGLEWTVQRA
jgi:tetratricopeptide (TPR) repeat protein